MLKVNEIFYSIQGESTFAGLPCVFVRLTGCNLRCSYCDTKYAYEEGEFLTVPEIGAQVDRYQCKLVEITGGEPLLQSETAHLAQSLIEQRKQVLVETNGTVSINLLPEPIVRIMDVKCPGSDEHDRMEWNNLDLLRAADNVKFVISHRNDFKWAVKVVEKYDLLNKTNVLFSPAFKVLKPKILAGWLLTRGLPIRLQLQLHNYLSIK